MHIISRGVLEHRIPSRSRPTGLEIIYHSNIIILYYLQYSYVVVVFVQHVRLFKYSRVTDSDSHGVRLLGSDFFRGLVRPIGFTYHVSERPLQLFDHRLHLLFEEQKKNRYEPVYA